jgi:uncharacterized protein YecE (DUF72 family)
MTDWFLGTMGFSYKEWIGAFYPPAVNSRNYLAYYSERFDAVEVDSTFYGTPRPEQMERWAAVTPSHFKFCPKTPRDITHTQRLVNADAEMSHFIDTMRLLGDKLGAILIQFPPDFTTHEQDKLAQFIANLPSDVRFAIEFRDRSWEDPETADLLRQHNIAWAAADYVHLAKVVRQTAGFLYLRFIGRHGQFAEKNREQVDKTAELQQWMAQIQSHLDKVNTVYGFFNNDYAGFSPATANSFKEIVGLEAKDIGIMHQGRLF